MLHGPININNLFVCFIKEHFREKFQITAADYNAIKVALYPDVQNITQYVIYRCAEYYTVCLQLDVNKEFSLENCSCLV